MLDDDDIPMTAWRSFLSSNFILKLLCYQYLYTLATPDQIVNVPIQNLNWTSQTFLIPTKHSLLSWSRATINQRNSLLRNQWRSWVESADSCRQFSQLYCLRVLKPD